MELLFLGPLPFGAFLRVFGLGIVFEIAKILESPSRRHAGCISVSNDGATPDAMPIWSHLVFLFACFGSWLCFLEYSRAFLETLFSLFLPVPIFACSIPRSALLSFFVFCATRGRLLS